MRKSIHLLKQTNKLKINYDYIPINHLTQIALYSIR